MEIKELEDKLISLKAIYNDLYKQEIDKIKELSRKDLTIIHLPYYKQKDNYTFVYKKDKVEVARFIYVYKEKRLIRHYKGEIEIDEEEILRYVKEIDKIDNELKRYFFKINDIKKARRLLKDI